MSAGAARRGRHATASGQGFGYVIGWTVAGALIPGSGLLAAGRRGIGWFLLLITLTGLGAVAAFLVTSEDAIDAALRLVSIALDPQTLLYAAGGIAIAAVLWVLVIVITHASLRRHASLNRGQRIMAGSLVLGLVVAVLAPAAYAADLALVQRALIATLFGNASGDVVAGERPEAEKVDPWVNFPRVNVLLIGSDAGDGREGIRPDTLILASIDTTTGETVMFSLPRNLQKVPFPLGTDGNEAWPDGFWCPEDECMINAIWSWAEAEAANGGAYAGDPTPGLTATQDGVEGVLGLPVHTYASVNLEGFQQFVDALGGVRIDVPRDLPIGGGDNLVTGGKNPITGYITAGQDRLLNGYEALWFARSREGSDDYERMLRQRCVIGAIISEADPLSLVQAYPQLAQTAKDNISTGIPQQDLQAWVELTLRVKGAGVRSLPFTDDVVDNRSDPDYELIRDLVQEALVAPAPQPGASVTPSPTASPGDGLSPLPTPTPVDDEVAQDVTQVC